MFALNTGSFIKHGNNKSNQTLFLLEIDQSKELRQKSPLGINGLRGIDTHLGRRGHYVKIVLSSI